MMTRHVVLFLVLGIFLVQTSFGPGTVEAKKQNPSTTVLQPQTEPETIQNGAAVADGYDVGGEALDSDPFANDSSLPAAVWSPPQELVDATAAAENNIADAVRDQQQQWIAQAKAAIANLESQNAAPAEAVVADLPDLPDAVIVPTAATAAATNVNNAGLPMVGAGKCPGTCKATSAGCSGGSFSKGLCPGAANIQCCIVKPKPAAPLGPACGRGGRCKATSAGCSGGQFQAGLCPGAANIQCCLPHAPAPSGGCGVYNGAPISQQKGNGGKFFGVTPIKRDHLSNPSQFGLGSSSADNTMLMSTACAYENMRVAAAKAGISLKINSGFRSLARQNYFWNCYITKRCNNGNLAARPGTSNHGLGLALDLAVGASSSSTYRWLSAHAQSYGFVRTVPAENWHWEHRPGWKRASYT